MCQNFMNVMTNQDLEIIRRNVNSNYYNVDEIIGYLSNNEIITKDFFKKFPVTNNFKNSIEESYLSLFTNIKRDEFIRRIPIYFYDSFFNFNSYYSMDDFFQSFISHFRTINGSNPIHISILTKEIDNVFKMLEIVMYRYNIPLNRLLNYLYDQGGIEHLFYVFLNWYEYISLFGNGYIDFYPQNILTALNRKRIEMGYDAYIFSPKIKNVNIINHQTVKITGLFPTDEQGAIIFKWVGLWKENIGQFSSKTTNHYGIYNGKPAILKRMQPILLNEVILPVNANSRILVSSDILIEGVVTPIWEEIYSGLNVMEFNSRALSEVREQRNISQRDFAQILGLNIRTYQRMEAGETMPDALTIIKIMSYLGIPNLEVFIKRRTIVDPNYEIFVRNHPEIYNN